MRLTMNLTPELERRLRLEASRQNLSFNEYALQMVMMRFVPQCILRELINST
jgi:predicted HicB family RNase H-like nuclease